MIDQKVLSFIRRTLLFTPGEAVVVGVSGGPDSVCLVHFLSRMRAKLQIRLHVAHLNHMLRGHEADIEEEYVRDLSAKMGLPFTIDRRDVRAYQEEHQLSEEEAAREVRYGFLSEVAEAVGAAKVAIGHSADDQVETILMHLIRGTGLGGLKGMEPISSLRVPRLGRKLTVVRPILELSREETEGYCEKEGLSPHFDATNYSLAFLRNRVRAELIPLLQSYNPAIKDAILRLAHLAKDDLGYIEGQASDLWPQVARVEDGLTILQTGKVLGLAPSLQRQTLRRAAAAALGDVVDIEAVHVEEMRKAMAKPVGIRLTLSRGLNFQTGYDACFISRGPVESSPWPHLEGDYVLSVPGETVIPGWVVKARVLEREAAFEHPIAAWHAHFDLSSTGDHLAVRGRRPGDRFQPLGMNELKKLQDFMVDAKIPRAWRDNLPLVISPRQIVWVVGWRIDERVKVSDATRRVLCIEFEPRNEGGKESGEGGRRGAHLG